MVRAMRDDEKRQFSKNWNEARRIAIKGLERLGHDIPITGYAAQDEVKGMTERRRNAGIKQKG